MGFLEFMALQEDLIIMMKCCGVYKRADVDRKGFEALIKASLDEYPTFKREYEEMCVFKS